LDVCDEGVEDMSGVALRERLSTRGASENVEDISGVVWGSKTPITLVTCGFGPAGRQ
jgi:hypothetical protein